MPGTLSAPRVAWWKGTRGEWYVVIQVALIALTLFGPRTWPGGDLLSLVPARAWSVAAVVLMIGGVGLTFAGGLWLGKT